MRTGDHTLGKAQSERVLQVLRLFRVSHYAGSMFQAEAQSLCLSFWFRQSQFTPVAAG